MDDDLAHVLVAPIQQSIVVRAGPGAGKTHLIAQRITHLLEQGLPKNSRAACITYTNAGVDEIRKELVPGHFPSLPANLFLGTIHSFLIDTVLGPYGHFLPDIPRQFILAPPEGYAARFCPPNMKKGLPTGRLDTFESIGYTPDGSLVCYRSFGGWKPSKEQAKRFKACMHKCGYVDLHDVLYFSLRLLREFPFIAECLGARFVSILVDEFQDTTTVQDAILETLQRKGGSALFLVGDPDQSIFSFAGAAPETFRGHLSAERFRCKTCGGIEHTAKSNRRSSRKIVRFLNQLSTIAGGQVPDNKWAETPEPVRLLVGPSHQPGAESARYREALRYFFDLLKAAGLDKDAEEAFCVLAYENQDIAAIQAAHQSASPGPEPTLELLRDANRRLYGIVCDLLAATKHRNAGDWALAYEATNCALTRMLFDASPDFCDYAYADSRLDRRCWRAIVWEVMCQLHADTAETVLAWAKAIKRIIAGVLQANGADAGIGKLSVLDCRGRAKPHAQSCTTGAGLSTGVGLHQTIDDFRTIHKAKGAQRDAVLVFASDADEVESWLFSADLEHDERSRRGYVAFSRARKVLCVSCEQLAPGQASALVQQADLEIVFLGNCQLPLF